VALLERHWPTLRAAGLASSSPARLWRARDKRDGRLHLLEMFEWRDEDASADAHDAPAVAAVWRPMEPLLDDMRILRVEPLRVRLRGRPR